MSGDRVAKERLYRTADGKVVAESHPEAAFLLAAEGDEIPEGYDIPKSKQAAAPADKQVSQPANKSAKADADK